jgi:hypothetical protein
LRFHVRRLVGAGSVGVVAAAVAVSLTASSSSPAAKPVPSPTPSIESVTTTEPPLGDDLADFRAVESKPEASAPIHRLPRVRLATVSVEGIPAVPLAAYRAAAHKEALASPGCHLQWWLLAGIGLVESGHAHSGGSMYAGWNGVSRPGIYGPVLDGHHGYKAIPDTDNGVLDGDKRWDRAVGPMQFLPSTWRSWGPTGHFDGHANPQNIWSAATAAAGYLCASGKDLSQPHALALAVYSYNHSFRYVRLVLSVGARYAGMTPDQLGVNLLPKDKPAKAHHRRHARSKQQASGSTARGTHRAPGSAASPSPSPSPSPSSSASPSPSPNPVPIPIPTLGGLHLS